MFKNPAKPWPMVRFIQKKSLFFFINGPKRAPIDDMPTNSDWLIKWLDRSYIYVLFFARRENLGCIMKTSSYVLRERIFANMRVKSGEFRRIGKFLASKQLKKKRKRQKTNFSRND